MTVVFATLSCIFMRSVTGWPPPLPEGACAAAGTGGWHSRLADRPASHAQSERTANAEPFGAVQAESPFTPRIPTMVTDSHEPVTPSTAGQLILDAIRTRRSIGNVRSERPPRDLIEKIIEAGTWAPNHRLTEPWRFIVLAGEARRAFGAVLGERQAAKRPATPGSPDEVAVTESRAAESKAAAKPLRAPVVIAVAVEPVVGPKIVEAEEVMAGAAAAQNMLLAAHALGLAAIWRTGDPAYDPAVKAFFGLESTAHLLGFIYVGYPEGTPPQRERTAADQVTRWLGWDDVPSSATR